MHWKCYCSCTCISACTEEKPLHRYISVDTTTNSETILTYHLVAALTGLHVDENGNHSSRPISCDNCSQLANSLSSNQVGGYSTVQYITVQSSTAWQSIVQLNNYSAVHYCTVGLGMYKNIHSRSSTIECFSFEG